MSDRSQAVETFLAGTPWADWQATPIAADASARRYIRLTGPAATAILMDADPRTDSGTAAFIEIAAYLTEHGLAAPRLLAADRDRGLLVLTDLGENRITDVLAENPLAEAELYDAATDVLVALDRLPPPPLSAMTPEVAGQMVAVTAEVHAGCDPRDLSAAVEESFAGLTPDRLALRDVHAENLIWRPDLRGLDRVGLLDFQDAFLAPQGYDLASLLSDVRREVSEPTRIRQIARFAAATGRSADDLDRRLATLAAQRNLRILGVFRKLIESGKAHYEGLMPRVWATLMRDLAHPALADLRAVVLRDLPPVVP